MTNEEAIMILKAMIDEMILVFDRDRKKALNMAIEALRNSPTYLPSAQQWIPCSERLPEEDGDYLVCFDKGYREDYSLDEIGIAPFEVDCEGFGIWQEEFDSWTLGSLGSDWVDIKVVAWMPLPTPYREE